MENLHFEKLQLNNSASSTCWLLIDDSLNSSQKHSLDTSYAYSGAESIILGLMNGFLSFFGSVLNLLLIIALCRNPSLRKDYVTPLIISLVTADFIMSCVALPIISHRFFTRDTPLSGLGGCRWFGYFGVGQYMVSGFNLLGIAIIRCIHVYMPTNSYERSFRLAYTSLPIMAWIMGFVSVAPTKHWGNRLVSSSELFGKARLAPRKPHHYLQ